MRCKLCLKERNLCNSHIIPEFMYKPLYDTLHRYHMISFESDEKNKYLRKGIREPLLCFDCEQHISKLETYSRNVFTGDINVTKYKDREFVEINNID